MRLRLRLAIFLFGISTVSAQKVKEYPVKAGEVPGEVLPHEAIYVLPAFTMGTASLRNGTSSISLFNYNLLLDEMQFINEAGDTLTIAEPEKLSSVVLGSMVFYYDKGYVREILKQGGYKLAVKQGMVQIPDKTRGGYDMSLGTGSIQIYGSVSGNSRVYHLEVKKDVLFREVISYYIADGFNHFLKANKKNFYTLFEEKKITKYLEEHKVDFNKEEDLEALLRFCAG